MIGEIITGLAGLAVGAVGGYAAARLSVVRVPDGASATPAAARSARVASATPADDGEQVRGDRERLVAVCADLADRLRDRQPALYKALARDLRSVGVMVEAPDGEPFDAARHHAVGTEPAPDAAKHLIVAETMRLGYTDRDTQVRPPEVIVYRSDL